MQSRVPRRTALKLLVASVGGGWVTGVVGASVDDLRSIAYGEEKSGEIDSSDPSSPLSVDEGEAAEPVSFQAERGDEILAKFESEEISELALGLERPDGTVTYEWTASDNGPTIETSYIDATPTAGEYTFWVGSGEPDDYGTYTLSLDRKGTGHVLEAGDERSERIDDSDVDWSGIAGVVDIPSPFDVYMISGVADSTVTVRVSTDAFVPSLYHGARYRDDFTYGAVRGSEGEETNAVELTHEFTENGHLEVGVFSQEESATGPYSIGVTGETESTPMETATPETRASVESFVVRAPLAADSPISAVGVVADTTDTERRYEASLSVDGETVATETVTVRTGSTPVRWHTDRTLEPGGHTLTMSVGDVTVDRTVRVTPLEVTEFYTQPTDGVDETTGENAVETVIETTNPTDSPVEARTIVDVVTTTDNQPTSVGAQSVNVPAGERRRLYFQWEGDPTEPQRVTATVSPDRGPEMTRTAVYGMLGTPLPTTVAYAAGTAPRGDGHTIRLAELVPYEDVMLDRDEKTMYVPVAGDGDVEIRVEDASGALLGEATEAVDTTAQGEVMEYNTDVAWVPVDVSIDEETRYLVLDVTQDRGSLWAVGGAFAGSLADVGAGVLQLLDAEGPESDDNPPGDPNAVRYEHVAVAELSGYPVSNDLESYAESLGERREQTYEAETKEDALVGLADVVGGFVDDTFGVVSTFLSVGSTVSDQALETLRDRFGVEIELRDATYPGDSGKISVYDYGTDDPDFGVDADGLERAVDVKLTGVSGGEARVVLSPDRDWDSGGSDVGSLDLLYLSGGQWRHAGSVERDTETGTVRGTLPAAKLTETPVGLFDSRGGGTAARDDTDTKPTSSSAEGVGPFGSVGRVVATSAGIAAVAALGRALANRFPTDE